MRNLNTWTLCYGAGSVGGLAVALIAWFFGALGIPSSYGVRLAPELTAAWIYGTVIWGGVWALLFSLPILPANTWSRGAIIALVPALVQLFLIYPIIEKKGVMGSHLGDNTYVFILGYYLIWGMVVAAWLRYAK